MKRRRRPYLAVILCVLMLMSSLYPVSAAVDGGGPAYALGGAAADESATEKDGKEKLETEGISEEVSEEACNGQDEENGCLKQEQQEASGDMTEGQKGSGQAARNQILRGQGTNEKETDNEGNGKRAEGSIKEDTKEETEEQEQEKEAVMEEIAGPDGPCFSIQSDMGRFQRSVNNGSKLQVNSVRFDKFYGDVGLGSYDNPQLGVGIKYIDHDNETPDADGKWRYVYCLNFQKSSPTGQYLTYQGGWTNKKIAYCLYYGAMFWRQPCRYAKYSTGDWQLDYFVTQCAIHVLNGEFSLSGTFTQIDKSPRATAEEKALAKDRINKLVGDANNNNNYSSFTQDGWFDASAQASFRITVPTDFAGVTGGYATGYSTPTFQTAYNLDMKEQITGFQVSVPGGVSVQKKDEKTYSDFRLFVDTAQYRLWQLTGKTVTATVKATAPKWWGGGIYKAPSGSEYQDCVMWTYTSAGGSFSKPASFDKKIPKKTFTLDIQKKDAQTGAALTGAVFSLWAYDGAAYHKKLGTFTDKGNGDYSYAGIDYTSTKDGWFLIKEDKPPQDYEPEYVLYNNADIENYQKYGGREVQLTADGFTFDGVPDATVFQDNPMAPRADIVIKKTDADTGKLLEGAEFKVYEWDGSISAYKESALCTLKYDRDAEQYVTEKPVERTEANAGKFRIVETKLPEGYQCPWAKEIEVKEKGTVTMELDAPNYPERNLTVGKKIKVDEITWAHGNPVFLFAVKGTDRNGKEHSYHRAIEFTQDYVAGHSVDGFVTLNTVIRGIPAGEYKVEEVAPVMRYILTDAIAGSSNITIKKKEAEEVNGVTKIQASVAADLRQVDGKVIFENSKIKFNKTSHSSMVINTIYK